MEFVTKYEERISSKTGKKYSVLVIKFPNGYEKLVFPDHAENYMLQALKK